MSISNSTAISWQTLPAIEQNTVITAIREEKRNLLCAICQHPYQDPVTLKCQHVFCQACVYDIAPYYQQCLTCKKTCTL